MINKIKNYIALEKLIPNNEKVVIALSGGVDSMVLLDSFLKLGYEVIIAHVNHKKRVESTIEEQAIMELANKFNLKIEVLHLEKNIDQNFHNYAHNKRYGFFIETTKKYNAKYIATAHHQDDNLETILMNLMSGSNLYGYGGISSTLILEDINIIRPFLCLSKDDIKKYANDNSILYFEDSSNSEDYYTRNRIRHNIIPLLKMESNNLLQKTSSFSKMLKESFSFIREKSINYLKEFDNTINNAIFNTLEIALKKDIISLLLEKHNIEKNERIIDTLISIIENDKSQKDFHLKDNYIFKKRYDKSFIDINKKSTYFQIELESIDSSYQDEKYKIYFSNDIPKTSSKYCTKYIKLCYNDIAFPLFVRNRKERDVINLPSGHKKIKDLFIDKKIVKEMRESILLVEENNEILWVVDLAKNKKVLSYKNIGDIFLIIEECLF